MSYHDWLQSIGNIIPSILSWINSLTSALLGNYIVITILGFILFTSLFSFIYGLLKSIKKENKNDFDNIK